MNTHTIKKSVLAFIVALATTTGVSHTQFSPTKGSQWAIRATVASFFAWYFTNSHDWKGIVPNRTDTSKQDTQKVYLNQVLQSDEYDAEEKWDCLYQWIMQNRKDLAFMASAPYALQSVRFHFSSFFNALDPRSMFIDEPNLKPELLG